LTAVQKKSAKTYIIKTADRMMKLTTNSLITLLPASSPSSHFNYEVEAYLACLFWNMFNSQLTLYSAVRSIIESGGKHFAHQSGNPSEFGTALFDCSSFHFFEQELKGLEFFDFSSLLVSSSK
jgi:hypothetical protein